MKMTMGIEASSMRCTVIARRSIPGRGSKTPLHLHIENPTPNIVISLRRMDGIMGHDVCRCPHPQVGNFCGLAS